MFLKSTILLFFYFISFGSSLNSTDEEESNELVQVPKELFERLINKHEELIRLIQEDDTAEAKETKEAEIPLPALSPELKQKIKAKKLKLLRRIENEIKRSGKKIVHVVSKAGAHIGSVRKIGRGILKLVPKLLPFV